MIRRRFFFTKNYFFYFVFSDIFNLPLPALWTAVLGENNRDTESGHERRIPIEKIITHSRYSHFDHDIGALMMVSHNSHSDCSPFRSHIFLRIIDISIPIYFSFAKTIGNQSSGKIHQQNLSAATKSIHLFHGRQHPKQFDSRSKIRAENVIIVMLDSYAIARSIALPCAIIIIIEIFSFALSFAPFSFDFVAENQDRRAVDAESTINFYALIIIIMAKKGTKKRNYMQIPTIYWTGSA